MNMFSPQNVAEWREWLAVHHEQSETIWVAVSKKGAAKATVSQSQAVDEALCYGWIDGTARSLDADHFLQSFTRRKPKSVWSKINKEKVKRFTKEGKMATAGLESIAVAKKNGSWTVLDEVEKLVVPEDLAKAFRRSAKAKVSFESLSQSSKKLLLKWLVLAQRPETRKKRIEAIVKGTSGLV